jgi:hypothetical protein
MRRTQTFFIFIALGLFAQQPAPRPAPVRSAVQAPPATYQMPVGQTFTYDVDWRLFNAGTATIRVETAGRETRVYATADAAGVVSVLYHVHDTLESFLDPKTFCSRTLNKHTEEGRRRLNTNIVFDYTRGKSVLDETNLRDNKPKHEENEIPSCVADVVSSPFYIASLPLTDNATYTFPLNDGGKTADVNVAVEGKEELKLTAGTFNTIRVRVMSNTGKLKDKGQLWLWLTDDARRLPVQMKARMFWGTLLFRLEKFEGQKP